MSDANGKSTMGTPSVHIGEGFGNRMGATLIVVVLHSFPDVLQGCDEIVEDFGGNHDAVTVRAYLFRNPDNLPAGILLEIEEKGFSIGYYFFTTNDIVLHSLGEPPVLGCRYHRVNAIVGQPFLFGFLR